MYLLFLLITPKRDWETFYEDEVINQVDQLIYVGSDIEHRSYTYGNIYVKNSLFESLKASTNGGGICCEDVPKFLAEDTQFVSCTTSLSGGAIHFDYSNMVLHKVCGFNCRTLGSGQDNDGPFANTYVTEKPDSKNFIIESQISHCTNPNYGYTVSMHYGKISYQYANESRNNCSECSVFRFGSGDTDGSANYSSFCNNIAVNSRCFHVIGVKSFELSNCNFVSNYAGSMLFSNEAHALTIKNSCILNNECSNNCFQHAENSQYEIIECTLDCEEEISGDYYMTEYMHASSSFIVALNLLNTGNCYGTYDVIGTLTPIIPTPQETPYPTKNLYILSCSCQRNKSIFLSLFYLTSILFSK